MPNKILKSGRKEGQKGMLAHTLLTKTSAWYNAETIHRIEVLATPHFGGIEPLAVSIRPDKSHSLGFSTSSGYILGSIESALSAYTVETARDWAKQFRPSDLFFRDAAYTKFSRLANEWRHATMFESSVSRIVMHPAYQQIVGMGHVVLPFILGELEQSPDHWFWALKAITGHDPVSEENRGNVEAMAAAWVKWGREKGYC